MLDNAHSKITLAVDGGIKLNNIAQVATAGANSFVMGSGLLHTENLKKHTQAIRQALQNSKIKKP